MFFVVQSIVNFGSFAFFGKIDSLWSMALHAESEFVGSYAGSKIRAGRIKIFFVHLLDEVDGGALATWGDVCWGFKVQERIGTTP